MLSKKHVSVAVPKVAIVTIVLAIVFYCLDYFFRMTPGLVLNQLMRQYHTNPLGMGLFASAFYLGYTLFQIPGGFILDALSPRWSIVSFVLLCTLSFILFIYSTSFELGVALRFLIGVTSAISFISVIYIARMYFPEKLFTPIAGITIGLGTLVASFVQVVSAYFMNYFSWQSVLSCFALIGLVVAIILMLPRMKLPAVTKHSEDDPQTALQKIKDTFKLLLNYRFVLNGVVGGLFYMPTSFLGAVWGISFLKSAYHLTSPQAAAGILLIFLGWAVGSPLVGLFQAILPCTRTLLAISAVMVAAVSGAIIFHAQQVGQMIYILLFLFGAFSGAQVFVWKQFAVICPKQLTGTGTALTNMLILAIVVIAHPVLGYLINLDFSNIHAITTAQYIQGLKYIPYMFLIAAVLNFFVVTGES